jgi:hypothetical protein
MQATANKVNKKILLLCQRHNLRILGCILSVQLIQAAYVVM